MAVLREPQLSARIAVGDTAYGYYTDADRTIGHEFQLRAPCTFKGWKVHSAKTGTVNLRLGFWKAGSSTPVAQKDISFTGPGWHEELLTTPYQVTLADLQPQTISTDDGWFYVGMYDLDDGGKNSRSNGIGAFWWSNGVNGYGSPGGEVITYGKQYAGILSSAVGWGRPQRSWGGPGHPAIDPIIDWDDGGTGYSSTCQVNLYGEEDTNCAQQSGDRAIGLLVRFDVVGDEIDGIRFYTPYAGNFRCVLWNRAGTGVLKEVTVSASAGETKDALFSSSYAVTGTDMEQGGYLMISVYDTSGVNFIGSTSAFKLRSAVSEHFHHQDHGFYYGTGDVRPGTSEVTYRYPIGVLIKSGRNSQAESTYFEHAPSESCSRHMTGRPPNTYVYPNNQRTCYAMCYFMQIGRIDGVSFWTDVFGTYGAKTFRAKLWTDDGTERASGEALISADGMATILFDTPYVMTLQDFAKQQQENPWFWVSVYETSGLHWTRTQVNAPVSCRGGNSNYAWNAHKQGGYGHDDSTFDVSNQVHPYSHGLDALWAPLNENPITNPPVLQNLDPAEGSANNLGSTNVVLEVVDNEGNLDASTVVLKINGTTVWSGDAQQGGFTVTKTGVTNGFEYDIDPPTDFADGPVTVEVYAEDLFSNVLDTSYQFIVGPLVYSFTTSLSMPTSTEFPCMDVGAANMGNFLTLVDVTASRGTPHIQVDGADDLVVSSDDGVVSSVVVDLAIGQKFTFETNFKPSELPEDLTQLDKYHFFVGVFDKQDNAGGILISKAGLAILSTFGLSEMVIPGSQNIFEEGETYYTMRIVVDGTADTMHLYVTKTSELTTTGHVLRYTMPAPVTPTGTVDSAAIQMLGQSVRAVTGKFSTLRCNCTEALIPNRRPIADPGSDQTANIGSAVTFDGTNSYDPEGAPLTYEWALTDAPDSSRFKISGTGSTQDDTDGDGFTTIFNGGSGAFSEDDVPLLQPGDHLIIDGTVYEVSTTRWVLDSSTGRYERDTGGAWDDDEIVVTEDTLPDDLSGVSWEVLHSATFFSDRLVSTPYGIPDIPGLYTVQLIVNDGYLDSLPAEALLNTAETFVPLGCVPDVSFIWDHITDFWRHVEDSEKVELIWAGFAQACAAQLLEAWQIDYNKSLLDTQRVFNRRWMHYNPLEAFDPDEATVRILRGPILTQDLSGGVTFTSSNNELEVVLDDNLVQTIEFSTGAATAQEIADRINEVLGYENAVTKVATVVTDSGDEYVSLEYATLLRIRPTGTANSLLGFSTSVYTNNDLQGADGAAVSATRLNAFEATTPPVLDFTDEGVGDQDLLVKGDVGYRIKKVAAGITEPTEDRGLTLEEDLPDDTSSAWIVPSVVVMEDDTDFDELLVVAGDLAVFQLRDANGDETEVLCSVLGVREERLGFDPQPLLEAYGGTPTSYTTSFVGVRHVNYIAVDELVQSIPRLSEVIRCPTDYLTENIDFTVGTVGSTSAIIFKSGTFSLTDPPPDTLWAEVTYLDNRYNIEANFGRLVNFKVEDLATRTDNLDYLSAVRGLWWAYYGGPSLKRVRVGTQIMLGLPFSEVDGTITGIEPNFSATEGRITIEDADNDAVVRTYFYPKSAGLATNDTTGETIAVGDELEQFAPLSGGVEVADWLKDADWFGKYANIGEFLEIHKYFKFLVRADVDTFSLVNLVFAIDFVKKIKPHYTYPLFVMMKNLGPDEVDVDDDLQIDVTLDVYDSFCPDNPNSYRWDDTDESGHWVHDYDETPPPPRFLYDTHRLCPKDIVWALMPYDHPGSAGWFYDTIWAYDDGDMDGDSISDDLVPLSGPDSSPPAPYGPLIGTIEFDDTIAAGTYWRSRKL